MEKRENGRDGGEDYGRDGGKAAPTWGRDLLQSADTLFTFAFP